MSDSRQYLMKDGHFPPNLALGFVRIANADHLPLSEAFLRAEPEEAVIRLNWEDAVSRESAMVVIYIFRLPGGEKEFKRVCESFGERKERIRLPEGIAFAPEHNAFVNVGDTWTHAAWAESKYELRHTYQRDNLAMFVRWSGTRKAMITHPLFAMVRENVRIVDNQWETNLPETIRNEGGGSEFTAGSIDETLCLEITASAQRARDLLGITADSPADTVPRTIREFLTEKKISFDQKAQAIELGALWGESLCTASGWIWRLLQCNGESVATVVCSPEASHFVDPIQMLHSAVQSRASGAGDHQELLFKLIRAGNLPASAKGVLSQLR